MDMKISPKLLYGSIDAVPSKSVLHRALICAALAFGESKITNIVLSEDIKATALALRAIGAQVRFEHNCIVVNGIGGNNGLNSINGSSAISEINDSSRVVDAAAVDINCGESGSTLRFMIPVAAALGVNVRFTGEGQLPRRPLQTYFEVLGEKGIVFNHDKEANLPLYMRGRLTSGTYTISGSVSSQYITGLLLALPICEGDSVVTVKAPFESKGYVDVTLSVMKSFGITVAEKDGIYTIRGNQKYQSKGYNVEGDWSQTAAWLCAGAMGCDIVVNGMDPASKQGDAAIMDILRKFGANIETFKDGGIRASKNQLSGILIDATQIPDIIPVLAVVAAFARGKTKIINAGRLRFKESDRLAATAEVLNLIGADVKIDCDSLIIHGKGEIQGGTASGYNDHRIVMALSIAACGCNQPVTIEGYGCIKKSYPHFYDDYRKLGGEANGIDTRE